MAGDGKRLTGPNGGSWIVDFKRDSAGVRQSDERGKCTVIMSDDDFVDMLVGRIDPQKAFMAGKIRIKGNMGLALKLSSVLAA